MSSQEELAGLLEEAAKGYGGCKPSECDCLATRLSAAAAKVRERAGHREEFENVLRDAALFLRMDAVMHTESGHYAVASTERVRIAEILEAETRRMRG